MEDDELRARARAWIEGDPDPGTRDSLREALEQDDLDELRAAVAAPLSFGTAGLRGEVGPGPGRMNRAVVIRTTWAVARHLEREGIDPEAPVCVGFDARPDSARFCRDVVGVLVAAGRRVVGFDEPTPTPLVAWAARETGAAAAIVVTASHNPPDDNGYKLYGPDAVQITSPTDAAIAALIDEAPQATEVDRIDEPWEADAVEVVGRYARSRYLDQVVEAVVTGDDARGELTLVHTSMHGVGGEVVREALGRCGVAVTVVPQQHEPDGRFPTVSFPNPEEPGALDLAFALADDVGADLVLANDPDTDRLAVAVLDDGGWRRLSGNEVAVLLADDLLARTDADRPLVTTSIVTTPWVGGVAQRHGARSERTLTGFKWIWRAALELSAAGWTPVLGAEEALGYSVGTVVRDKDGIAATVAFVDLARRLAADGTTVLDRLAALRDSDGAWVAAQVSAVREGAEGAATIERAMSTARRDAPGELAGERVAEAVDMATGEEDRPPWLPDSPLVEWTLADGRGRVLVRPSGTEPKLKCYVDLRLDGVDAAEARARAEEIGAAALRHVGLGG